LSGWRVLLLVQW